MGIVERRRETKLRPKVPNLWPFGPATGLLRVDPGRFRTRTIPGGVYAGGLCQCVLHEQSDPGQAAADREQLERLFLSFA